jgi:hypothetical protein
MRDKATAFSNGRRSTTEDGLPLNEVAYDVDYCEEEEYLPLCKELVSFKRDCGHIKNHMECSTAFKWSKNGQLTDECNERVRKLCVKCEINTTETRCCSISATCKSEVQFILDCGHQVSWICGKMEDPRYWNCRECHLAYWNKKIVCDEILFTKKKLDSEPMNDFERKLSQFVKHKINEIVPEELIKLSKIEIIKFLDARNKILKNYLNQQPWNASTSSQADHPFSFGSEDDFKKYHIVYSISNLNDTTNAGTELQFKQFSRLQPTRFGFGHVLWRLNNVEELKSIRTDDGILKLVVGVAFTSNILKSEPPFVENVLDENTEEAANKTMKQYIQKGYDCVSMDANTHEMVYWTPYSVLPVLYCELKFQAECMICLYQHPFQGGIFCSNHHFLCWDCFELYIKASEAPDAPKRNFDQENNLACFDCQVAYSMRAIAKGPEGVLEAAMNLRVTRTKDDAVRIAIQEENEKHMKKLKRIREINNREEQKAEMIKLEIINDILNLRCPNCKMVFVDYDGCCALTCNICRCGFCAYCLKNCGEDAHAHVPQCGKMFMTMDEFIEHHRNRRTNLIKDKLNGENVEIKLRVKHLLTKELTDLKIII